jgi:hypothetical protein
MKNLSGKRTLLYYFKSFSNFFLKKLTIWLNYDQQKHLKLDHSDF